MRIVVWRKPEFSGDFVVAPNGTITHPLFRVVQVAGLPFATAEANLRKYLSQFEQNPEFVMEPLVSSTFRPMVLTGTSRSAPLGTTPGRRARPWLS